MAYTVYRARLISDSDDFLDFWGKNFPKWPTDKFSWFYANNPDGEPACWALQHKDSPGFVGTCAVFPRKFTVNGKEQAAGLTGDLGVSNQHRLLGPALQLQKSIIQACNTGEFPFLYGFPNKNSRVVQSRAGFSISGQRSRLVKIVRTHRYIATYIKPAFLASILATLIDGCIRIFKPRQKSLASRGIRVRFGSEFDKQFDQLWHRVKTSLNITGVRDSSSLSWRFKQCPFIDYGVLSVTLTSDDKLHGYIVFRKSTEFLHIADILVDDIEKYLPILMEELEKFARSNDHDAISIEYTGANELRQALKKQGFVIRSEQPNFVCYSPESSPDHHLLADESNWYLTEFDND